MARFVKEAEYAARRKEILDVAQRLVYTKGYDRVSIQDILSELQISKGAFYHYFDSKQVLLEALIESMYQEVAGYLLPIVQDPGLSALEKILRFFDAAARWKTARKDYLLSLVRVWYADENAVLRQKVQTTLIKKSAPMLATIIRQGVQEGVLTTPYPDQAGEIAFTLFQGIGDIFVDLILAPEPDPEAVVRASRAIAAYNNALERVLGAPPDSLKVIDLDMLKDWIVLPVEEKET